MANKSTRRAVIIAKRRRQVSEMYLGGKTQPEIARIVEVSQSTISVDLKWLQAEWLQTALMSFNKLKARELARIDRLEREYWVAWERSQLEYQSTLTEQTDDIDSKTSDVRNVVRRKAQVKKEQRIGDKAFLTGIQWCIEQRLKIFGVYAAQKVALTWEEEAREQGFDPDEIVEDVRRFIQDKDKQTDA